MRELLLLVTLVVGCGASVPMAPESQDAAAKRFAAPPGKANLYVYRPKQFKLSAVAFYVTIDGKAFGATKSGSYLFAELLAPGRYEILSESESPAPVALEVEPGKSYFYRQEVAFGALKGRSFLFPVDAQTGREDVATCEMASSQPPAGPSQRQ